MLPEPMTRTQSQAFGSLALADPPVVVSDVFSHLSCHLFAGTWHSQSRFSRREYLPIALLNNQSRFSTRGKLGTLIYLSL